MSLGKKDLDEKFLLIGKVTKPHGLRGDVKIYSFSGQPENFKDYRTLTFCDLKGNCVGSAGITNVRVQGQTVLVKIAEIDNRNQAEAIEGYEVFVEKASLPEAKPGEFYWHQYTDKQIIEPNGSVVGVVKNLFHSGAQDILVIDTGRDEVMVPVIKEIILEVRDDCIIVDLPPGLLDINADTIE